MQEVPVERRVVRRRVLKGGMIIVAPPTGTLNVRIRDLSENGAMLEIEAATLLPENFDLIVISD